MVAGKQIAEKIREIATKKDMKLSDIAKEAGFASRQNLGYKLSQGKLYSSEERSIMKVLGYDVVWVPKGQRNLSDKDFERKYIDEKVGELEYWLDLLNQKWPIVNELVNGKESYTKDDIATLRDMNKIEQNVMKQWTAIIAMIKLRYDARNALKKIKEIEHKLSEKFDYAPAYETEYLKLC